MISSPKVTRRALANFAAVLALWSSTSPSTAYSQFAAGPLGGLNLSNLQGSPQDFSTRNGVNGGVLLNPQFNRWVSVQLECYYSQKGANGKSEPDGSIVPGISQPVGITDTVARKVFINYFEAPLMFRLTSPGEAARVYMQGGGAAAWRLNCTLLLDTSTGRTEESSDCTGRTGIEIINGMDFSYVASVGIEMRQGGVSFEEAGQSITIDLRMINGFRTISGKAPDALTAIKTRVWAFSIRYPIGH